MGETPPNPSRLANGQGFRPPPPQPFTTCKWTRVGGPPKPSPLANGQGLPPSPQPFTTCKWTRVSPPPPCPHQQTPTQRPNPLRLADGQGLPSPPQPITTCKWTRVAGPPTFMTWGRPAAPNPSRLANGQGFFTTCKWTRVGGPATLHDLGAASKWTRVGADFQMDKGWGPPSPRFANGQGLGLNPSTLHDLQMDKGWGPQPFTWTRVGGPPTLHSLQMDNGWTRVGDYQHCLWTRVGPPQPFAIWGGSPYKLYRFNIRFQADQAPCPKIDKSMTGPFRPRTYPNANLKF